MRLIAIILAFAIAPLTARADLLVFAAASLKEPLDRIAAEHEDVTVSYGGSGALARQVMLGAPADVVLLANDAWMEALAQADVVQSDSIVDFASNRLVLIGPSDSAPLALTAAAIEDRRDGGRIATGLTTAVPVGIYAKAALESLDLWDGVAPYLAEVDNVRAALALVARGQAPLGIVYSTDVRISAEIKEVAGIPITSHPPIRYTGAVTVAARPDAVAFLAYVTGEAGQTIMAEAGFLPPVSTRGTP